MCILIRISEHISYYLLLFDRLDAISCDAELQEKSEGDLKKLAQILLLGCEQAVEEYNKTKPNDETTNDATATQGIVLFKDS